VEFGIKAFTYTCTFTVFIRAAVPPGAGQWDRCDLRDNQPFSSIRATPPPWRCWTWLRKRSPTCPIPAFSGAPISPPTVEVEINYPGANSETVEQSVATNVEAEVNGAENMIYMSSRSSRSCPTKAISFVQGRRAGNSRGLFNRRQTAYVARLQTAYPPLVMALTEETGPNP